MQRQRRLGGRRSPRGRRSFMNRGQLDAPDADVHFGGRGGGMPMRARCSRGPRGRRGREHGRRDEARRGRNQRRGCRLASRCNGFCRLERHGRVSGDATGSGSAGARMARAGNGSSPASSLPASSCGCGTRRGGIPRGMPGSLRTVRSAAFVGAATEATGVTASGEPVWSPTGGSNVAGKAGIRQPRRRLHRHALPERSRRKVAQEAAHAVTISR